MERIEPMKSIDAPYRGHSGFILIEVIPSLCMPVQIYAVSLIEIASLKDILFFCSKRLTFKDQASTELPHDDLVVDWAT